MWPQFRFRPEPPAEQGRILVSHAEEHEGTRRDFLYYATAGAGAVTAGAAIWPLVDQMNPSADVQALSSIRVDVSGVEVGSQLTVKWLGKPVFIRRRTEAEGAQDRDRLADDVQHHLLHGVREQRIANALDHDGETEGGKKLCHIDPGSLSETVCYCFGFGVASLK